MNNLKLLSSSNLSTTYTPKLTRDISALRENAFVGKISSYGQILEIFTLLPKLFTLLFRPRKYS